MGIIHIAGFPVQIGPRYRQRCAWCGEVLIDGDLSQEMSPADAAPSGPGKFALGGLVEVIKDGPATMTSAVEHHDGDQLPDNACIPPRRPKLRAV